MKKNSAPALALAALVLLVATACSAATDDRAPAATDEGAAPAMAHIHGIGVDPKNGAVYAGTHYGLFRIEDGKATRVADRVQDFMGFTVAGPDHFLASGHPGEGQGGPSSVGLIESKDAGKTWHAMSLAGKADFHALEYQDGRTYGLNSMTGQLLTSTDLTSWDEVSKTPIADFAISPSDGDTMVATTQQGLALSSDGGRTFKIVASAPLMVFVGWGDDGALAGVTPEGTVYTTKQPDAEWTERGSLGGQPEAFTVQSATQIYAATNATLLASTDGGATFVSLTQ